MNPNIRFLIAAIVFGMVFQPAFVRAQGALTPPGAPVPAMKTLDQIEARTPIGYAGYSITTPGSYYLTANLVTANSGDVIIIHTNGVTLDLNGFTLFSTATSAAGAAIEIAAPYSDITILNGHIISGVTNNGSGGYGGPGFGYGILAQGVTRNFHVTGVTVSGCLADGINLGAAPGASTLVESCTVQNVGGLGIVANTVTHSAALSCGNSAIVANTVSDSTGQCSGSTGDGIHAQLGANNSTGLCNGGDGLGLSSGAAINCRGQSVSGNGIYIAQGSANGCVGSSSSGNGILINSGTVNTCSGLSESEAGINAGTSDTGISPTGGIVNNSYGSSQNGDGIDSNTLVNGSLGISNGNGYGIYCYSSTINSIGYAYSNGIAVETYICIASWGFDALGYGSIAANNKYNVP